MMEKKRIQIVLVIALSIFTIVGCSENKGVFDGNIYVNKVMGIKIIPPKEWIIEETQNFIGAYVTFYSTPNKQTCIQLTKNKVKLPTEAMVANIRDTNTGIIIAEGKSTFNGMPAYIMDFIYDNPIEANKRVILLIQNGRSYGVMYYIVKDNDYHNNMETIYKSLETLQFQK